jgi:hypothetical protein
MLCILLPSFQPQAEVCRGTAETRTATGRSQLTCSDGASGRLGLMSPSVPTHVSCCRRCALYDAVQCLHWSSSVTFSDAHVMTEVNRVLDQTAPQITRHQTPGTRHPRKRSVI